MGTSSSRPAHNYDAALLNDRSQQYSIEIDDPAQPANCGKPRRQRGHEAGVRHRPYATVDADGGPRTLYEMFQRGVRMFPNNECLGTRPYVTVAPAAAASAPAPTAAAAPAGEEQLAVVPAAAPAVVPASNAAVVLSKYQIEDKQPVRGPYRWQTYAEIDAQQRAFGAGLVALGYPKHTNVGIFSSNREEWMITALGLYGQNMRVVALYASLGEDAVEYIINHAETAVVCVSAQNLPALLKSLPKLAGVKHIVQWDVNPRINNVADVVSEENKAKCREAGIELIGFSEVQAKGAAAGAQASPAAPEDIAYIMYTSGTTGNPKGAILLHSNVVATCSFAEPIWTLKEDTSYLSYLPLAHIFETIAEAIVMSVGGRIGYFQDNIKKLTTDMQDVKPVLFCGVPRIFTRIHQVVMNGVAEKPWIVRWFFNRAFQAQSELVRKGRPVDASYDAKIFAPLRKKMGLDNVKIIVTGAAPMAPYLMEFLKVVSGAPVLEGYGMTEATASTSCAFPSDPNVGHTGPPQACCEVRLEDIPEMGYTKDDQYPRGEICVKGPSVFAGYWKDEANTKATIIDGWLHTGDVGRWNPNGTLSIIDRKKNLFKLSQGEYVSAETIESAYQKCGITGQVWVYGNSFKSFLLGVIVPAPEPTAAYLFSKGWWPKAEKESTKLASEGFAQDYKAAMNGPHKAEINAWVVQQLRAEEKPLKGYERVKEWIIDTDIDRMGMVFNEQNNTLTPTFKLRRPQLLQKYINQLKELYGKNGEPVAADERWPGQ